MKRSNAYQSGSISVRTRILVQGINVDAIDKKLVDDVLSLLGFFHFMEHYPARAWLASKQDRSRMNGQSLTEFIVPVLTEISFR
jgi:hypothetical protein